MNYAFYYIWWKCVLHLFYFRSVCWYLKKTVQKLMASVLYKCSYKIFLKEHLKAKQNLFFNVPAEQNKFVAHVSLK